MAEDGGLADIVNEVFGLKDGEWANNFQLEAFACLCYDSVKREFPGNFTATSLYL